MGIDSKNITQLFDEINKLFQPKKAIILFDEIDALASDRANSNDLREMRRVTSTILQCLDNLNKKKLYL
ncbi:AAA family ATPase [Mycoplasma leachii]|uniref:AAA family ATPase n=1 Tax=Mycoplasma leachii TaxID=2105 RepID=UPI00280A831D|nr:AAA family ATPase [Mycoplasma leachii]